MKSKAIALVAVSIASLVGITVFLVFQEGEAQVLSYDGTPKALIIDQLYYDFPNDDFHKKATKYFQAAGYSVDIITTEDVTVEYYKNLPSMHYKFIVIRTHGADNEDESEVVLFTGEKYTEQKYIQEQLFGQVKKATPLLEVAYNVESNQESNWVVVNDTYRYMSSPAVGSTYSENAFFAISPKMIESMQGKFNDTIFVLGGCNTLSNPSLAKALVEHGAAEVFGWDASVGNIHNDYAMLYFLEQFLINDLQSEQIIENLSDMFIHEQMPYPATFIAYT